MPGFSSGGISHTQSPTGLAFMRKKPSLECLSAREHMEATHICTALDVDDDPGPPAPLRPLQGELMEGHRLRICPERHRLGIDHAPAEMSEQLVWPRPRHPDFGPCEDFAVPVLSVDQFGQPVMEQKIELGDRK